MYEASVPTESGLLSDLVRRVAEAKGVEPTDLPPLGYSVDPEALEALVSGEAPEGMAVSFEYCGFDVTVDTDGTVDVAERD